MSRMRADPCASEVTIGTCQPCHERAGTPASCKTDGEQARRHLFAGGDDRVVFARGHKACAASPHQPTSSLVLPDMAETTTATSKPALRSRATCLATLRMRSMFATDVPPNFMTRRDIGAKSAPSAEVAEPASARGAFTQRPAQRINANAHIKSRESEPWLNGKRFGQIRRSIRKMSLDFDRLGEEWWREDGPDGGAAQAQPRPGRLYARSSAAATFRSRGVRAIAMRRGRFKGLGVLDVGCGAGILAEPLAQLGARVTAIDPAPRNIEVAQNHAAQSGLEIDYRCATAEDASGRGRRFRRCPRDGGGRTCARRRGPSCAEPAAMVRPGGLLFAATLNRTLKSFAFAIVGAEYVLRWAPRGTHNWSQFITPRELKKALGGAGLARFRRDRRRLRSAGGRMAPRPRHGRQLHDGGGSPGLMPHVSAERLELKFAIEARLFKLDRQMTARRQA